MELCQRVKSFALTLVSFTSIKQRMLSLSGDVEINPGPLVQHTECNANTYCHHCNSRLMHTDVLYLLGFLDCQCSHHHIYKIATMSFNCFNLKAVAKRLVGPQLAQKIIGQKELSEQDKRDEVLEKWLEVKGSSATYRELVN